MDVSAITRPVSPPADVRMDAPKAEHPALISAHESSEATDRKPPVDIAVAIAELEQVSSAFNRRLAFSVNEKLGEVVVKVIDTTTDKVIKEIPPVEVQRAHERIREVIGILFDERV